MSTIPNLFGEIDRAAPTPAAVLKVQANYLSRSSGGLLVGEVRSRQRGSRMEHVLLATAPALDQQLELLKVEHVHGFPYPAVIVPAPLRVDDLLDQLGTKEIRNPAYSAALEHLEQDPPRSASRTVRVKVANQLASYGEFEAALRGILGGTKVRGLLNSLVSKSNQALEEGSAGQPEPE